MEFLRYPQVIPILLNACGFGPPIAFTLPSTCSWIDHSVSGLLILTRRALNTWFPFGFVPLALNLASISNSPDRSTKSTRSFLQLPLCVNKGFQVLFHSPFGVLFNFPSQYYALSVTKEYLGLEGGPPCFKQDFSCPALLWILPSVSLFRLQGFYLLWLAFPIPFYYSFTIPYAVLNPKFYTWFGLLRFRSPLLSQSRLIFFPART